MGLVMNANRIAVASLSTLIILHLVMLTSLLAGIPPHPPQSTPLFGIAPLVGMSVSLAVAAILMGTVETRLGAALCVLAALVALVSFGPQKYSDVQFPLIWPAVLSAQVAIVALIAQVGLSLRRPTA